MIRFSLLLAALLIAISCSSNPEKKRSKSDLLYAMGTNHMMKKQYTQALDKLVKAEKIDPENSQIQNNLGMAYYFKGDMSSAKKHLSMSLSIDTNNADARNNLASIYLEEGKLSLAEEQYVAITKTLTYANQFRTYFNLGVLYQRQGDNEKAMQFFKKSVAENVNYCPGHYKLGSISYREKDFTKALEHFKDASMGGCYKDAAPHYRQAVTLYKLERFGEALAKFEVVVSRFSGSKFSSMAQLMISQMNNQFNANAPVQTTAAKTKEKKSTVFTPIF